MYQSAGSAGRLAWGSFEKGSIAPVKVRPIPPLLITNPVEH